MAPTMKLRLKLTPILRSLSLIIWKGSKYLRKVGRSAWSLNGLRLEIKLFTSKPAFHSKSQEIVDLPWRTPNKGLKTVKEEIDKENTIEYMKK